MTLFFRYNSGMRKSGVTKSPEKYKKYPKSFDFRYFFGGDGEDRTLDLLNAIQALSQLSYAPDCVCYNTTVTRVLSTAIYFFLLILFLTGSL